MLTLPLWFLGAAVLLALAAPTALTVGRWQVFRPRWALALWFGALFLGLALTGLALVASIVVAVLYSGSTSGATIATVGAWLAVFTLAGAVTLVSALNEPLVRTYRRSLHQIAPVATAREDRGEFTLVRFDSDDPVAIAVPGKEPEILLSSALTGMLTTLQLQALLAHEFAHLRARHDILVRIAEINAACWPRFLPGGRLLKRSTLFLVELAADDLAARQAGPEHLALALDALAAATGDLGIATRAERLRAAPASSAPLALPAAVRL